MKGLCCKLIIYLLGIGSLSACKGDDSGQGKALLFRINNKSSAAVTLIWFRNSGRKADTCRLPANSGDTLLYYITSPPPGIDGLLREQPVTVPDFHYRSPYDSVRMVTPTGVTVWKAGDCTKTSNPLCLANYKVIADVNRKKKRYREYLFVLE